MTHIRHTRHKHARELLGKSGVVAVGVGVKTTRGKKTQEQAIVCTVERKRPLRSIGRSDLIPSRIGGYPTDVVESGTAFRAPLPLPLQRIGSQEYVGKERPCSYGRSIGHKDITAGTLGCLVTRDDGNGPLKYILTNNHVAANSNAGKKGDPVLQPGPYDGGNPSTDVIGNLFDFVPIEFGGSGDLPQCPWGDLAVYLLNFIAKYGFKSTYHVTGERTPTLANPNLVDAALVGPVTDAEVRHFLLGNPISQVHGTAVAGLGMEVVKSGRTTEFTAGVIEQIDVTAQVQYGQGQVAVFEDQVLTGAMSAGGDSGSLLLDRTGNAVGLLFAGSDQLTLYNRIHHVTNSLNCTILAV